MSVKPASVAALMTSASLVYLRTLRPATSLYPGQVLPSTACCVA